MTYIWHPSRDYLDHSNVARLMRTLGVTTADELRARSVADIGAFWDTVVHDLGIEFRTPYSQVVDLTRGTEYPEWFVDGTINIVDAALGRWKGATPGATATSLVQMRFRAASAPSPSTTNCAKEVWSKRPTASRTARCSCAEASNQFWRP